jgi:hypothetical protein
VEREAQEVGLTAVTAEEKTRWAKAPDGTRGFTPGHRSTEKHSMEELRSATIEAEERRKRRAIQAPAGFVYSGHSCRAGSLSEASALGVCAGTSVCMPDLCSVCCHKTCAAIKLVRGIGSDMLAMPAALGVVVLASCAWALLT